MASVTRETFATEMTKLATGFDARWNDQRAAVYWEYLKHCDEGLFVDICRSIHLTEMRFPAIAVFNTVRRTLRRGWDGRDEVAL